MDDRTLSMSAMSSSTTNNSITKGKGGKLQPLRNPAAVSARLYIPRALQEILLLSTSQVNTHFMQSRPVHRQPQIRLVSYMLRGITQTARSLTSVPLLLSSYAVFFNMVCLLQVRHLQAAFLSELFSLKLPNPSVATLSVATIVLVPASCSVNVSTMKAVHFGTSTHI
jgi:hypothetical protein